VWTVNYNIVLSTAYTLHTLMNHLVHTRVLHLELTTELSYMKFLTCETTFGSYLCDLHRELLDARWSYEKQQQEDKISFIHIDKH